MKRAHRRHLVLHVLAWAVALVALVLLCDRVLDETDARSSARHEVSEL